MSTNLRSRAKGVDLTRFYGGEERGSCVQVIVRRGEPQEDCGPVCSQRLGIYWVPLTRTQAKALAKDLRKFAKGREVEDYNV